MARRQASTGVVQRIALPDAPVSFRIICKMNKMHKIRGYNNNNIVVIENMYNNNYRCVIFLQSAPWRGSLMVLLIGAVMYAPSLTLLYTRKR